MKLIFEKSVEGRVGVEFPKISFEEKKDLIPKEFLRETLNMPEVGEVDVVRHYTKLSTRNYGIDTGFYPLGSCTMKYNPKINEITAAMPGFALIHPSQPEKTAQGAFQLMYELERDLCELTGFDRFSLQPAAGAQGELVGIMIMQAFFRKKREKRTIILVTDSSHGTNPASAALCKFHAIEVKSDARGNIDLTDLKEKMTKEVAGLMLTNPSTLGLFEEKVIDVCKIVHDKGGLVYCDGANMNAILGKTKPANAGFDIMHLNLHKTFSTPHGGGGPGAGPVGVIKSLVKFLPKPLIQKEGEKYFGDYSSEDSIGKVKGFFGNFGVLVRAYTYIKSLGAQGLEKVAENAVLNANYILANLKENYHLPYDRICMHEFVLSDKTLQNDVNTIDVAKKLLDFGFHAPTIYFPLIVHGAIMIEPTETESKETMDEFISAMKKIYLESQTNPENLKNAPVNTPVGRLDAVKAARYPVLRWNH